MTGKSALPRWNGELVFEAPWEGRAFGVAVSLKDRGFVEWDDFRDRLIGEVAGEEGPEESPRTYYEQWLAALEALAIARGFVRKDEVDRRADEYASGERSDDEW